MSQVKSVVLINDLELFLTQNSELSSKSISHLSSVLFEFLDSGYDCFPRKTKQLIGSILFPGNNYLAAQLFSNTNKLALVDVVFSAEAISHQSWIVRSALSRLKLYKKQTGLAFSKTRDFVDNLSKHGFAVIDNFLPPEMFSHLQSELLGQPYAVNAIEAGLLRPRFKLHPSFSLFFARTGFTKSIHSLKQIINCIDDLSYTPSRFVTKQCVYSSSFCQRLKIVSQDRDHQKDSHIDTFFPSLKFWYFLSSVSDEESFQYSPSSHNLGLKRMVLESEKIACLSNSRSDFENSRSGISELEGSLRFSHQSLSEMGLNLQPVSAKSNSLVVADTSGIHSRGIGQPSNLAVDRLALHGSVRHKYIF